MTLERTPTAPPAGRLSPPALPTMEPPARPRAPSVKPPPARRVTAYLVLWAVIGILAAGYLAALAVRPELITENLPTMFQPGEADGNQGQRAMSKAFAEVQTLRNSVSQIQLDVSKLKADNAVDDDRHKSLGSRVAALEEKVAVAIPEFASVSKPAPGKPANPRTAAAEKPATEKPASDRAPSDKPSLDRAQAERETPNTDKAAKPVLDTELLGQVGGFKIETGSIVPSAAAIAPTRTLNAKGGPSSADRDALSLALAPSPAAAPETTDAVAAGQPKAVAVTGATRPASAVKPVAANVAAGAAATGAVPTDDAAVPGFGPAVVKAAKEPIGLRISKGTSLDALRLSWSLLADRHGAQLKNLEARYVAGPPNPDGEQSYDLLAGPVRSSAEAKRICKALAAKNIPCQVGAFSGDAL